MKSTVSMLSVAFLTLAGTQILPDTLLVSVVQIGLTGAVLVWFVAFILQGAHVRLGAVCGQPGQVLNESANRGAGSIPNQVPSGFPHSA